MKTLFLTLFLSLIITSAYAESFKVILKLLNNNKIIITWREAEEHYKLFKISLAKHNIQFHKQLTHILKNNLLC